MDENVHGAITRALQRQGLDVVMAQGDIPPGTPDPRVLDRATELGRVLFSQDDDLLREAAKRQRDGEAFCGVVYAHQSVAVSRCIEDLALIAQAAEPAEFADAVRYLPLT